MSSWMNDALAEGRQALQAGDAMAALIVFHRVLAAADESTLDSFGKAQSWIGECYVALERAQEAETSHALAITTLTGFAPDADELPVSIRRIRASQSIADDEPDAVVIATAWKLDAIIKANERDAEGVFVATRQATATIAEAFGRDHPRQAEIFAQVATRLAVVDAEGFAPLIAKLTEAGLRVADPRDISSRAMLLQARIVERMVAQDMIEARALCEDGLALTDGVDAHADDANWFRERRASIDHDDTEVV
jgi:hypothetical protein